jgi:hypothetical protein
MKIITLWEPWASFVARGFKKWETRSWPTNHRGSLAIHAAKTAQELYGARLLMSAAGIIKSLDDPDDFPKEDHEWPLGKIIAVCKIADCLRVEDVNPTPMEKALGNYSPGRYAWILEGVQRVKPFAYRGMQGLKDLTAEIEQKLEYVA